MDESYKKTTLKNGIRILTQRMPHSRSVTMGVWVDVGSRDETESQGGLCHFIEHMLFKGTERRDALQIAKEFDSIGGLSNAFTSKENTCYHAKVMDVHLDKMVDILSDIFLNSLFDPQEVERERGVILQEIKMVEDIPEDHIHVLSAEALWAGHPLGRSILGAPNNILGFDSELIKSYIRQAYEPGHIVVSAAGNVDHDRLVNLTAQAFEAVRQGSGVARRTPPMMNKVVKIHEKDLEQIHICLNSKGVDLKDDRRHVCSILNVILGGNMSSRLFQEVREKRGLAYSVYSYHSSYTDSGTWTAYVAVDESKASEALDVIVSELQKMKRDLVDPSELSNAKEYSRGGLYIGAESNENQMIRIAHNETHFGRFVPLREVEEKIDAVSAESILELANEMFDSDCVSLTALGPIADDSSLRGVLNL